MTRIQLSGFLAAAALSCAVPGIAQAQGLTLPPNVPCQTDVKSCFQPGIEGNPAQLYVGQTYTLATDDLYGYPATITDTDPADHTTVLPVTTAVLQPGVNPIYYGTATWTPATAGTHLLTVTLTLPAGGTFSYPTQMVTVLDAAAQPPAAATGSAGSAAGSANGFTSGSASLGGSGLI